MKAADGDTFVAQTSEGIDMTFKIISEEEKTVQVGDGTNTAVAKETTDTMTIPSQVECDSAEYLVVKIADKAFNGIAITDVIIPEGITEIGSLAFGACNSLQSVILPEGLTTLKSKAFVSCPLLKIVLLPTTLTTIESQAFAFCESLSKVIAKMENPVAFGSQTFYRIGSLCGLHVPVGTKEAYIGAGWTKELFKGGIVEGDDTPTVGFAFTASTEEGVDMTFVVRDVDEMTVRVGVGVNGSPAINVDTEGVITIPETVAYNGFVYTVNYISDYAFVGCNKVEKMRIAKTVTGMGRTVFASTNTLKSVVSFIQDPFTLSSNSFPKMSLCGLHVPEGTKEAYIAAGWTKDIFGGGVVEGEDTPTKGFVFTVTSAEGVAIACSVLDVDEMTAQIGDGTNIAIAAETKGTVTIPATVEYNGIHYTVNTIGNKAFNATQISDVIIPEGIITIGGSAFEGCSLLQSVVLPEGLTTLYYKAFVSCPALKSVVLPSTLTTMDSQAFAFCTSLASVIARMNPPITFGSQAFYRIGTCGLHVPEGTKEDYIAAGWTKDVFKGGIVYGDSTLTGGYIFTYTTIEGVEVKMMIVDPDEKTVQVGDGGYPEIAVDLKTTGTVTIPAAIEVGEDTYTVNAISAYSFAECTGITSVVLPETIKYIYRYAFYGCSSLKDVNLNEGIEAIGYAVFYSCSSLKEITLPSTLQSVGDYVLGDCSGLKNVYANMMVPPTLPENAFYNLNSKCVLHVPEGTIDAYHEAGWTEGEDGIFFKIVEGDDVPAEGTEFKVITVEGVELTLMITSMDPLTCQVGSGEKNDPCVAAETRGCVTIPATAEYNGQVFTVTAIGDRAFRYTKVDSVYVPETVGTVIQYAFANCENLSYVSLPDSIKSLGMAAFYKCPNLKEIELPDSLEEIGGYAFSGSGLEIITLPAGVKTITRNAFSACPNLKWVFAEMPEPVAFGQSAFDGIDPECVLIVPQGTKAAYIEAGWNQDVFGGLVYESIREYRHDVNKDGSVDINDVVAVINKMAGTAEYPKSDTNRDEHTDINDVVSIINFMAGR